MSTFSVDSFPTVRGIKANDILGTSFHAWQSALLFTAIFILHLIFSWSSFFGWLFFLGDLALIGFLTMRAYRDADMLDRYEVPFFGPIANRFLNDE